jgi:hypothetical protein
MMPWCVPRAEPQNAAHFRRQPPFGHRHRSPFSLDLLRPTARSDRQLRKAFSGRPNADSSKWIQKISSFWIPLHR